MILKTTIFTFMLALVTTFCGSQNLLPDGSFEIMDSDDCFNPEEATSQLKYWYSLNATPDLIDVNCPLDETGLIFWDATLEAYEGQNYAGLYCRYNSNETYTSEGIATTLFAPLEAGQLYYFEIYARNKGTYSGFPDSLISCPLDPKKHLDLYLSTDSIVITNDTAIGTSTYSGHRVATITNPILESQISEGWGLISTCFQAAGGELFFAMMQPLDNWGELPACIMDVAGGTFQSFYYDFDFASLTVLPEILAEELIICEGKPQELDLLDLFELPILSQAQFIWEDGWMESFRTVTEPGVYSINAALECGEIQLLLTVGEEKCSPDIFVPNAFSPNDDGYNDIFLPFFNEPDKIVKYHFTVFDRWGNQVYDSMDQAAGWDGTFRKNELPTGVFLWALTCEIKQNENILKKSLAGEVVLLK